MRNVGFSGVREVTKTFLNQPLCTADRMWCILTRFWRTPILLVILFRSKLTSQAGADYDSMNTEMQSLVRQNPGFIDVKSYKSDDGERLTVVWWRDEESLRQWRDDVRHRLAQDTGRQKWYEYYKMEVAKVERQTCFERRAATSAND